MHATIFYSLPTALKMKERLPRIVLLLLLVFLRMLAGRKGDANDDRDHVITNVGGWQEADDYC